MRSVRTGSSKIVGRWIVRFSSPSSVKMGTLIDEWSPASSYGGNSCSAFLAFSFLEGSAGFLATGWGATFLAVPEALAALTGFFDSEGDGAGLASFFSAALG